MQRRRRRRGEASRFRNHFFSHQDNARHSVWDLSSRPTIPAENNNKNREKMKENHKNNINNFRSSSRDNLPGTRKLHFMFNSVLVGHKIMAVSGRIPGNNLLFLIFIDDYYSWSCQAQTLLYPILMQPWEKKATNAVVVRIYIH